MGAMGYRDLPQEIEEKIVMEHLETFSQLAAFSGVCRFWRSTALPLYRRHFTSFPGILVFPQTQTQPCPPKTKSKSRATINSQAPHHQFHPISKFFNPTASSLPPPRDCRTTRTMHVGLRETGELDPSASIDLQNCHYLASNDGWLLLQLPRTRHSFPVRIFLLNPVTGGSILLPPLEPVGYRCADTIDYAILSASPEKQDCHVIVLSDRRKYDDMPQVAWCKVSVAGGRCWKFTRRDSKFFQNVASACFFGGKLYVADGHTRSLHVFDNLINVTDETVGPPPPPTVHSHSFSLWYAITLVRHKVKVYALELGGELVLVLRSDYEHRVTFEVYKVVVATANEKRYNWEQVRSLDGHTVLLGTHHSFCLPRGGNNGTLRGDHIYYMDSGSSGEDCDSYCGVFSVEDEEPVERHNLPGKHLDYVWFCPMPFFHTSLLQNYH